MALDGDELTQTRVVRKSAMSGTTQIATRYTYAATPLLLRMSARRFLNRVHKPARHARAA